MGNEKHIQRAGDESTQYQAKNITVINNNGITEERAREIFNQQNLLARKEYTEDANRIASERIGELENRLMRRISEVENMLPSFADPAFQLLLRRSQIEAASTEREADYDLLTELLVCHVQKGSDRKNRAGINRAVEIVGEIDNDALCGLTVVYALEEVFPVTGNCIKSIQVLNNLFSKLIYQDLPVGKEWLDHLDVLRTIRLEAYGEMKKVEEYYSKHFCGYICAGIKENSEEYKRAIALLDEAKICRDVLIPNECLEGYYRLAIRNEYHLDEYLDEQLHPFGEVQVSLNEEQVAVLKQIWRMYSKKQEQISQAKNKYFEIWDSFETLHKLKTWWNNVSQAFFITQVGRVLAHTNAKRCDPTLPDLI